MPPVKVAVLLDDPEASVMLIDRTMQSEVDEIMVDLAEPYTGKKWSGLGVPVTCVGYSTRIQELRSRGIDLLVVDYGGITTGYGTSDIATSQLREMRTWADEHPSSAVIIWTPFTARWYRYEIEQEAGLGELPNIFFYYGHAGSVETYSKRLIGERELSSYDFNEPNPAWATDVGVWLGITAEERAAHAATVDAMDTEEAAAALLESKSEHIPIDEAVSEVDESDAALDKVAADVEAVQAREQERALEDARRKLPGEGTAPVDGYSVGMISGDGGEGVASCPIDVHHSAMALQVQDHSRAPKTGTVSFKAHMDMYVGEGEALDTHYSVGHVIGGGLHLLISSPEGKGREGIDVWLPLASFIYHGLHAAGKHDLAEVFKNEHPSAIY